MKGSVKSKGTKGKRRSAAQGPATKKKPSKKIAKRRGGNKKKDVGEFTRAALKGHTHAWKEHSVSATSEICPQTEEASGEIGYRVQPVGITRATARVQGGDSLHMEFETDSQCFYFSFRNAKSCLRNTGLQEKGAVRRMNVAADLVDAWLQQLRGVLGCSGET